MLDFNSHNPPESIKGTSGGCRIVKSCLPTTIPHELCYGSFFCLEVILSFKTTRQGTEPLEILRKTHTCTHLVHHIYLVKYTTWIKLRCLKLLILLLVFQHLGKVRDEDFQPRLEIKEYWMSCFSSLSYHSIWFPWLPVAKEGTPGKLGFGDTSSLKRRHIYT